MMPNRAGVNQFGSPKTEQDYKDAAPGRFEWIGIALPANNRTPTEWKCLSCGNTVSMRYGNAIKNRRCRRCSNVQRADETRLTAEDYAQAAASINCTWLESEPPQQSKNPTKFQCNQCRGVFYPRYHGVKKGAGCPTCGRARAGQKLRNTEERFRALAVELGYIFISISYRNGKTRGTFECPQGHQFTRTYTQHSNYKNCPRCIGRARVNEDDYRGASDKCEWAGSELPVTSRAKTIWRCKRCSKSFEMSYASVKNSGSSCPHCQDMVNGQRVSKPQRRLCEMFNGELNHPVGRLRIDVALPAQRIAIEFDEAHWHHKKQDKDARRAKLLMERGWRVLSIKASDTLPSKKVINAGIKALLSGETYHEIVHISWHEYLAKKGG
jgi:very-short-patch-repair endonuclease/Zn finger protein HypA/HybF involved in hydrogenase expression